MASIEAETQSPQRLESLGSMPSKARKQSVQWTRPREVRVIAHVKQMINIDMKANVNVNVEGVMFAAKGSATAKVEGGASVNVRGGIVAIN